MQLDNCVLFRGDERYSSAPLQGGLTPFLRVRKLQILCGVGDIDVFEFFLAKFESAGGATPLASSDAQFERIAQESDGGLGLLAQASAPDFGIIISAMNDMVSSWRPPTR